MTVVRMLVAGFLVATGLVLTTPSTDQLPPPVYAPFPTALMAKVLVVALDTVKVPLAAVLPCTPVMVTLAPLVKP